MRFRSISALLFGLWILFVIPAVATEHYDIVIDHDVEVTMRDGVILRAEIYRPEAKGKFPVILERTPYDKSDPYDVDFARKAASRGYVMIVQDCRGRFASEGEWYPFLHEGDDGYDTVEWAAKLPYSNGKVGMEGSSYLGVAVMQAALAAPPHLVGIVSMFTASNYHDDWTYQGGAFQQWFNQSWLTTSLAPNTLTRRVAVQSDPRQWLKTIPLSKYPVLDVGSSAGLANYYLDWLAHPNYDDYWKRWSVDDRAASILVPCLHIAGWYDIFLEGSLRNYESIKSHGGSEAARRGQRLIVMPGGHVGFTRKLGDVDYGDQSVVDTTELRLRWFDYLLKGIQNGFESEKPVKIFVMGKNIWREEDDWPLRRAKSTRYYLHSEGKANTLNGDGELSTAAPLDESPDQFVYDPDDPVPTRGGSLCCVATMEEPGPRDQRSVESRLDVLVYTTPVFKQDFEVTGPLSLELYVKNSAVDTDLTAKLVDVWPDGLAQSLTDGILRVRYRNSWEHPDLMKPGKIYKISVDLGATSNVFLAGHRLRLEVSSSNFPRFDRNLNTGESPETASRQVKAQNTIIHDRAHPSYLLLPVIPK